MATCDVLLVGDWVTRIGFNIAPCLAVRLFNDPDTQFVFTCVLISGLGAGSSFTLLGQRAGKWTVFKER